MKRPAIGVLLGALTLFIYSAVSWMVLPWNAANIKGLPQEQLISDTIKTVVDAPGVYMFPSGKTPDGKMGDQKEWEAKYQKGPIGFLVFSPTGCVPMGPSNFIYGFLSDVLIAGFALYLLSLGRERLNTVAKRTKVVVGLGIFTWLVAHVPYWIWFHFPLTYTLTILLDTSIAFLLLGLVLSKFVPE